MKKLTRNILFDRVICYSRSPINVLPSKFCTSITIPCIREQLVREFSKSSIQRLADEKQHFDPVFAEKQELFRKALLESIINKGNKDGRFYWACFTALASFGTMGFEVLFRMLEIPFVGLGYAVLLSGYVLMNRSMSMLTSGGNIAKSMGGIEILSSTTIPEHQRVFRIVEELSESVQLKKIPKVYWIDCEEANAFASGYSMSKSCITVTRGLVSTLNEDELKSVIGHEMGHILNGDMKTGTLIAGMISGFAVGVELTKFFDKSNRQPKSSDRTSSSANKGKDNSQAILGMIILLSYVTMLAGKLLSVAVSRHREYASDAIASALTHPFYIRDALRKISNQRQSKLAFDSQTKLPTSDATNHLLFFEREGLSSILSTHPTLEERIANLEKIASFDVEDFRKVAKVSVMRDERAKNTILSIIFIYFLFIIALIYQVGEEVVLQHLNAAPQDVANLFTGKGFLENAYQTLVRYLKL